MMDYEQQLLQIYREDPCRTLPNAFWKTASQMENSRLSIRRDDSGNLSALALWQEAQLMAFWTGDPGKHPLTPRQVSKVPFALVHETTLPIFEPRQFSRQEAYFRLRHQGAVPEKKCPTGFVYQDVNTETEIDTVASFIQACYQDMAVDSKTVRGWLNRPVFAPDLWVWVTDENTGQPAGLGIAELDWHVPEASLEWIQVLPRYQKQGLGTAIVSELLRRIPEEAGFTTVAGRAGSAEQPEKLYRGCGFSGSDVWWLLTD